MTLPTKTDIETLNFADAGGPFVNVVARSNIDTDGLDYSLEGAPFWAVPAAVASGDAVGSSSGTSTANAVGAEIGIEQGDGVSAGTSVALAVGANATPVSTRKTVMMVVT